MFKKGNTIFNEIKGGLFPGNDLFDSEQNPSRVLEPENYYENKIIINNANIHRTNTQMAQPKSHMLTQQYAEIKRKKALKDNAFEDINNNQNIKKKVPMNQVLGKPNQSAKNIQMQNNSFSYNYNNNTNNSMNNSIISSSNNDMNSNYNDNRIKKIPISLKKINLNNKRSLSRNAQSPRNTSGPYIHKSPFQKRKCSMNHADRNNKTTNFNNDSNLYKTNQSPKKGNLIPKPNMRNIQRKNNLINNNINKTEYNSEIIGNKRIGQTSLNQNTEIRNEYTNEKKEIDIVKKKKRLIINKGALIQKRNMEKSIIKIQSVFRGYLTRKKLYSLINNCIKIKNGINILQKIFSNHKFILFNILKKCNKINSRPINLRNKQVINQRSNQNNSLNKLYLIESHFKNTYIDNFNRIIINIPKRNYKNNANLLFQRKYILKFLFTKKVSKIKEILKKYFERYKQNALNKKEKEQTKKEKIDNVEEFKIKKLRDIIRKKIYKNKEIMHRVFIKYYYSSLYIHLNWYIYVVNQLSCYTQNIQTQNTQNMASTEATTDNSNPFAGIESSSNNTESDPFRQTIKPTEENYDLKSKHSSEVNNALRQSIQTISKMHEEVDPDQALRESILSINKINDELAKEAVEKEKTEKKKKMKDLIIKKLKAVKNDMHKFFTKFYYQGKLVEKENQEKKVDIGVCQNEIKEGQPTRLRGKKKENPALEMRNKARNLRKLMMKKEKEKSEKLRFYFYKFHTNGVLFQLKKNAKKTLSTKNVIINIEEMIKNNDKKLEEVELTLLDQKIIEQRIEKEKLQKKRIDALKTIFYKTDRQYTLIKRKTIEKWNLRAKILSLSKFSTSELKKSETKKKKKLKKSCRTKKEKNNDNEENIEK